MHDFIKIKPLKNNFIQQRDIRKIRYLPPQKRKEYLQQKLQKNIHSILNSYANGKISFFKSWAKKFLFHNECTIG